MPGEIVLFRCCALSLPKALRQIQEQLTDENMQELNARVDLDRKDPAEVAREYLMETGLIAEG